MLGNGTVIKYNVSVNVLLIISILLLLALVLSLPHLVKNPWIIRDILLSFKSVYPELWSIWRLELINAELAVGSDDESYLWLSLSGWWRERLELHGELCNIRSRSHNIFIGSK